MSNTIQTPYNEYKLPFEIPPEGAEINKKFSTGEKIPLNVKISGDVFNYETTGQVMTVAQTIFLRFTSEGPEFRFKDSDQWGDFQNVFTGELGCSLGIHGDSDLLGAVHLVANKR